jgi:hypothetical protein
MPEDAAVVVPDPRGADDVGDALGDADARLELQDKVADLPVSPPDHGGEVVLGLRGP